MQFQDNAPLNKAIVTSLSLFISYQKFYISIVINVCPETSPRNAFAFVWLVWETYEYFKFRIHLTDGYHGNLICDDNILCFLKSRPTAAKQNKSDRANSVSDVTLCIWHYGHSMSHLAEPYVPK